MRRNKPLVVGAIPAYNEEKTIAKVILLAQKHVDKVIVCDDGSTDMTTEIAERLGADVVRHSRNLGYGAAIQSLFRRARELGADIMVTLDGDGQHDPEEIPALIKPVLKDDVDIAVGSRFLDKKQIESIPLYRRLGIQAITKLAGIATRNEMSDAQHGFRAYGRKALEGLEVSENGMGVSVEILMKARERGLRVMEVPIGCNYQGLEKTSTHNPLRHGASIVMSIVKLVVEDKPMLFLGVPGIVSLLVGLLFGVWMLQIYAINKRIVTNIALASIAFTLLGFFAISTAITLYAITRVMQKANKE
jgi:glycosyltransferase involved in cell wall biosynthesis